MLVHIFLLCLTTFVDGKLCENHQFWSSILERCENCSRCAHPDIVLRPCQEHTDTVCGPLSELNIDWTWLKTQGTHSGDSLKNKNIQKEMLETFKENFKQIRQHEKHMREKQKYLKQQKHTSDENSKEIEDGITENFYKLKKNNENNLWNKLKLINNHEKHKTLEQSDSDEVMSLNEKIHHLGEPIVAFKKWEKLLHVSSDPNKPHQFKFNDEEAFELLKNSHSNEKDRNDPSRIQFDENGILIRNFGFSEVEDNVKKEKLVSDSKFNDDFSPTEKFILDWQTIILGIAVSSCLIFFLVAAIYSVQNARHWKKLRNYFDADVEELQAWISSKNSKNKVPSSRIYKATTEVLHTSGTQCKYLERIIKMNGKNKFNFVKGNVYEKDNKPPLELKPLSKKYITIQKNTGDQL